MLIGGLKTFYWNKGKLEGTRGRGDEGLQGEGSVETSSNNMDSDELRTSTWITYDSR